ncbi:MAG: formate dehydrogenase subunit delta [Gammaproteobacteria bacterium]|jgi:formate dehydrogenase subunit delta|nr:formate dehydrogenase subunit delta [Gammaproteobacteria bacterium]MBT5205035.1 formate dehydrogenase subunit delta [Gammaproteobacteria bacterium]MBT5603719.1 formate dehydrogenase subunit delta [Gammaproteobacteria bacterium]MBT6244702.1 formate dehydrogenase subunit delta [Gammaproteobacteria bacterium]
MRKDSITRLLAMIDQIALNMRANGCDHEVAEQVAQHLEKFWSPKMKSAVIEHCSTGPSEVSAITGKAVHCLHLIQKAKSS